MAATYDYVPLSSASSTRLLLLQPNRQREADIYCTLQEISLDAPDNARTKYDALSYVWGAKSGSIPITCDGRTILITPNCELALRYLRDPKRQVTLWIDAIVINQTDLDERAQQVSIMSNIYRKANRVVIWLGSEGRATSRFFTYAVWYRRLDKVQSYSERCFKHYSWLQLGHPTVARVPMGRAALKNSRNEILIQEYELLIRHEWANRIWTVPELSSAATVVVKCGTLESQWHNFVAGLQGLHLARDAGEDDIPNERGIFLNRWLSRDGYRDLDQRLRPVSAANLKVDPKDVLKILDRAVALMWSNASSEILDMFFAIHPVLTACNIDLPKIDYTVSVTEMSAGFVLATLRVTDKFWPAYMQRWRSFDDTCETSWLLNPSVKTEVAEVWELHFLMNQLGTRHSLLDRACLNMSTTTRLYLRGKIISFVFKTGPILRNHDVLTGHIQALFEWTCFWYHASKMNGDPQDVVSKIKLALISVELRSEFYDKSAEILASKVTPILEDFLRACCKKAARLKGGQDNLTKAFSTLSRPDLPKKADWLIWHLINSYSIGIGNTTPIYLDNGLLGWTHSAVKEGDTIALVAGSDIPIILRPQGDDWRFIGPTAHLQGVMQGEQWPEDTDVDALETITLV